MNATVPSFDVGLSELAMRHFVHLDENRFIGRDVSAPDVQKIVAGIPDGPPDWIRIQEESNKRGEQCAYAVNACVKRQ